MYKDRFDRNKGMVEGYEPDCANKTDTRKGLASFRRTFYNRIIGFGEEIFISSAHGPVRSGDLLSLWFGKTFIEKLIVT